MALPDQRSGAHSLNWIQDLGACHSLGRLVLRHRVASQAGETSRCRSQWSTRRHSRKSSRTRTTGHKRTCKSGKVVWIDATTVNDPDGTLNNPDGTGGRLHYDASHTALRPNSVPESS